MSEARKWKIIEHSWRNTSIENEDGRIVCELDLESFDDLNENNQDKYEQLQRADAELIASAPALRDERDRLREALRPFAEVGDVLDAREFVNLYERWGTSGKGRVISMQHLKHAAAVYGVTK